MSPAARPALFSALLAASVFALLNAAVPAELHPGVSTDFTSFYRPVAQSLLAGDGPLKDGELATRYPPGWPVVLAATLGIGSGVGLSEAGALFVLGLISVAAVAGLVAKAAGEVGGPRAALAAGVLAATYPFFHWSAETQNGDMLFVVTAVLGLWLGLRAVSRTAFTAEVGIGLGVLAGLGSLVRPMGIALAPVFLAALAVACRRPAVSRRIAWVALGVGANVLTVTPWLLLIHERTGTWAPLSTGGLPSIVDGLTFGARDGEWSHKEWMPLGAREFMQRFDESRPKLTSLSALARTVGMETAADPSGALSFLVFKAGHAWIGTDSGRLEGWVACLQIPYLGLAAAGAVCHWLRGGLSKLWIPIAALVLYSWAVTVAVLPILRYQLPAMAALLVIAPAVFLREGRITLDPPSVQ